MRSVAGTVAAALVCAALAGCTRSQPAAGDLAVTTPPSSALPTVVSLVPTGPPTSPAAASPAPGPPAPGSVSATAPPSALPPPDASPLQAYIGLMVDWQRARSTFFGVVTAGRSLSLAQQHTLAAAYLRAERAFGTGLRSGRWPSAAAGAVRALLAVNATQQAPLAAMTTAPSATAFTERLADYGVATGREDAAVAAVQHALGG